jgi:integrase
MTGFGRYRTIRNIALRFMHGNIPRLRSPESSGTRAIRLNAVIGFFRLREEQTKNDKADTIQIHPSLIRELKEMTAGMMNFVFGRIPDMKSVGRDLLRAGLETLSDKPGSGIRIDKGKYVCIADAGSRRTDFHAMRHTFKTWVERTGCNEETCDALTRHGSTTIANKYRHSELADMIAALRLLPDPSPAAVDGNAMIVTGTDGPCTTGDTTSTTGTPNPGRR